jgi:hypothetical protein
MSIQRGWNSIYLLFYISFHVQVLFQPIHSCASTFSFPTFIFHFILYTRLPQSIYLKLDIFTDHEEHNKTVLTILTT